jgi:hypothetical protein
MSHRIMEDLPVELEPDDGVGVDPQIRSDLIDSDRTDLLTESGLEGLH